MSIDRITQLRILGLKAIKDLVLDLQGMRVLIGENGTGKSTVLEALEILRQAGNPVSFVTDILSRRHGGLVNLLRRDMQELLLGVTIEGGGPKIEYDVTLANVGIATAVVRERLDVFVDETAPTPLHALLRTSENTRIFDIRERKLTEVTVPVQDLAVGALGIAAQPAFRRLTDALSRIEVHVPFETRPLWQQRELDIRVGPRWPSPVEEARTLSRYAVNLANAFFQLRNLGDDVWTRVRERARLGLGSDFRDFRIPASGRGNVELYLVFGGVPDRPLPVECLSEGQLSYLAFLALVELHAGRSILAFDEPEAHMHPALLSRIVWMLEEAAETTPVLLATHSDRLLDSLAQPAESVVLFELDEGRATRVRRPNRERLAAWLEDYRGLGALRSEGYEAHVFADSQETDGSAP